MARSLDRGTASHAAAWISTFLAISISSVALGQTLAPDEGERGAEDGVEQRLRQLEHQLSTVSEENGRLSVELQGLAQQHKSPFIPAADDWPLDSMSSLAPPEFAAGYDEGFRIAPTDPDLHPFSLKINNQNQFRYTVFARSITDWTDNAGNINDVTNRNSFQISRGRLIFSGNALLPDLTYLLNIDYNTVTGDPIGFRSYGLSYQFNRSVEIHVGQNKVPGSREWLTTSLFTLGPDRSLATTFFRPSLSQGVWFTGEPIDSVYYHAMLSNGFNTAGTPPSQLNSRFCWSGSLWWEPWGNYGKTFSDLEWHDTPVIRCGSSLTYSNEQGQSTDPNTPENVAIRLSDGTLLTETGALAPGITLQAFHIGLAAFDLAFKHRGLSLSGEFYLQDLFGLRGNGPLPLHSTLALGGFAQIGYFVLPRQFEVYARTSQVSGEFGTGGEYAGGLNWYFLPGQENLRFTFDTAWINHSPADQNRTDYRAGDTGLLVRTQIQISF